ncbi:MAG: hypothetical protein R3185_05320 [Candidatus Thermoplasmatota archaeon]|nr:hypothetical protein [Candidatus Thermoplasmatota archaeon]
MRGVEAVTLLLALSLATLPVAPHAHGMAPGTPVPLPGPTLHAVDCSAKAGAQVNLSCDGTIRPGTRAGGCTLAFVVTDGTELYIATAGHCVEIGERLTVPGIEGELGTVVAKGRSKSCADDWAFYRLDPEHRPLVLPTMARWAGPQAPVPGTSPVREPLPGEAVLHYGHGQGLGEEETTRGRAGIALPRDGAISWPNATFPFAGSIGPGDSGSPVRLSTGEAAGIVVCQAPEQHEVESPADLVVATSFQVAMEGLATAIGEAVHLVQGAHVAAAT